MFSACKKSSLNFFVCPKFIKKSKNEKMERPSTNEWLELNLNLILLSFVSVIYNLHMGNSSKGKLSGSCYFGISVVLINF